MADLNKREHREQPIKARRGKGKKHFTYISMYPNHTITKWPGGEEPDYGADGQVLRYRIKPPQVFKFDKGYLIVNEEDHLWLSGQKSKYEDLDPEYDYQARDDIQMRKKEYGNVYIEVEDLNRQLDDPNTRSAVERFVMKVDERQKIVFKDEYEAHRILRPAKIPKPKIRLKV